MEEREWRVVVEGVVEGEDEKRDPPLILLLVRSSLESLYGS